MIGRATLPGRVLWGVVVLLAWEAMRAEAGGPVRRRGRLIETVARPSELTSYPMLGTFYPSPYTMVRGNFPAGGGYSPLDDFGDQTLVMYGPISSFRATAAPVRSYARGYDGHLVTVEGTSFSTPNQPELTPVIYPTQATYYYGPRQLRTPPWWANGINWIDQN
jgi:hypothetical protein